MGDGIKVDTADLRAKARQVMNVDFGDPASLSSDVQAPDSLPHTQRTIEHLRANAKYLAENQAYAKTEQQRLADTLNSVAAAYDEFDAAARHSIDSGGPAPAPVVPKGSGTAEPKAPGPLAAPSHSSGGGYVFIDLAQDALGSGDHGASLEAARNKWDANGVNLQRAATTFIAPIVNWEGDAADEAYGKFFNYGHWITELGQKWQALAREAQKIWDAHLKAVGDHNPVYAEYKSLEENMTTANQNDNMAKMAKLVKKSEDIQDAYTAQAAADRVTVDEPPPPVGAPSAPVTANGDPRKLPSDWKDKDPSQTPGTNAPGGGGAGGGGGQPPGGTPSMPQTPTGASPMSAESAAGKSPSGGGAGSGGGLPSGGGSPSGGSGSSSGGTPSLPGSGAEDMPTLPDDPGLHAASAGAGGGAGGGSGGGGAGSVPLQPNVGGVSVGPGPAGAGGAGGAPAGGGAGGGMGGMGGGMGGGHGGQAQPGKERKRTPGLSPDEDLYVEDREYTEEVIGARKRRTVQDPKDPT